MTPDQADLIALEVKHLTAEFRAMKDQNASDHEDVKAELKAINERISAIELWRARIQGALFSVPALVSLAVSIVGGLVLYALTN